jgi:hypothetical protein
MRNLVLALLLMLVASAVRAEIYECVDQSGNKRFTNIKSEAKGCKPMNIAPPNTVAPPPRTQTKGAAPANFPSVDAQTQKRRDGDRRRILEQELAEQESVRLGSERNYQRVLDRLEPYKKKVKLHEDNIANLKKELANTP